MSEVLLQSFTSIARPFTGRYGAVVYGDDIYIVAYHGVWKYSPANNVFTQLASTTSDVPIGNIALYNGIIYWGWIPAGGVYRDVTLHIDKYNISSGIYTANVRTRSAPSYTQIISNRVNPDSMYFYSVRYDSSVYAYYVQFSFSNESLASFVSISARYVPSSQQMTNGFYFGSSYVYSSSAIVRNGEFGTFDTGPHRLSSISDIYYNQSSFAKDGLIYIVGGENHNKITTFNPLNNIFTDLSFEMEHTVNNNFIVTYNNKYYMFLSDGVYTLYFYDYNISYDIKNNSGETTYKHLIGNTPINKVRFNFSGSDVGYVLTTLTGNVTGSYTPAVPTGYTLAGYSSRPNATSVEFGLNLDISASISQDFTFYEVYKKYVPPVTTFSINLYQNTAENTRVDKSSFLTGVGTLNGALRSECSIIRPSITFESDTVPNFNYCYIAKFSRYYFVVGITSINKNIWRMELSCDVLMTYKTGIGNLSAIIARQENDYNNYLIDPEIPTEKRQTVSFEEISNSVLSTQLTDTPHNYVLTVIGA